MGLDKGGLEFACLRVEYLDLALGIAEHKFFKAGEVAEDSDIIIIRRVFEAKDMFDPTIMQVYNP